MEHFITVHNAPALVCNFCQEFGVLPNSNSEPYTTSRFDNMRRHKRKYHKAQMDLEDEMKGGAKVNSRWNGSYFRCQRKWDEEKKCFV